MRISTEFRNTNQPANTGEDFKLLLGIFLFLAAVAVMTVLVLMPLPGFIIKTILIYTLVFMGLGVILVAAINRIMDQRPGHTGGG